MKEIELKASVTIQASPERVWEVLTQVATWPEWDPSCERIEGRVALGQRLQTFSKLTPGQVFPVEVSELVPNQKMVWSGSLPLELFGSVRTFTLTHVREGTKFTLQEVFSGPVLARIGRAIPSVMETFDGFVLGLKARVEGKV